MRRKVASTHKKNFLFSEPFDSNLLIWGSPVYAFPTNKHVLLCNQNRIIKIRKSTLICYYHWILRHIHILPYVSKMPFIAKEFSSESWAAFHSCIFLVSLNVAQFLSLPFTFVTLTLLKIINQLLCTVSFDMRLFHVSPLSDSSCSFCQVYHRDVVVFVPLDDTVWFFHFDHLNEMMSAILLLHCKVILFSFLTNRYCGKLLSNYAYIPFVIKLSIYL